MTDTTKWTVIKTSCGYWGVWAPGPGFSFNRFNSWSVAIWFAVRMAYSLPVMAHPFKLNPRDGSCLICEGSVDCHASMTIAVAVIDGDKCHAGTALVPVK